MIRINLLPFRAARKKENVRRQISIFFLSLILVFLVLFFTQSFMSRKIERLDAQIVDIKQEIKKYDNAIKEIKANKKKIATLKKKTEVIKNLEKNRTEPVKLLDAMTQLVVANRMWLTDFSSQKNKIEVKGIALDNETVADFMIRLENSKLFAVVNLNTLKQKKIQDIDMKSFHITCNKKQNKDNNKNGKK